jgi:hypothetical protein
MKPELLNHKEISSIIENAPVTQDHAALIDGIRTRYPDMQFHLNAIREGYSWKPGLIDGDGNRITDDLYAWIDQELLAANNNAREVWRRHKDAGLVKTEWRGEQIYITVPFGKDPDAFQQIEILAGSETTAQDFLDLSSTYAPEDRGDLISGPCMVYGPHEQKILSEPQYRFVGISNIRRFLRHLVELHKAEKLANLPEMEKSVIRIQDITMGPEGQQSSQLNHVPFLDLCPDWLEKKPAAFRFFQDWMESSAGRVGHQLCEHWFVQHSDYTNPNGKRSMYLCPQWADADGGLVLPEISPGHEASPYGVIDSLSEFDRLAGYPFAWYFYMLHGNRVTSSAGSVVARAIRSGLINPLPACDKGILLRWNEKQYGF